MSDEPIKGTIYPNNAFFKDDSKPGTPPFKSIKPININGEEKDVAMWINTADGEKVEWTDKMRAFFKKYKFYFKISERWIPKQGNGNIPKQPEAAQKSVETQDEEIPI
jgi:hypothetical protein|tara:strand:- start:260 stop:583 length:324 start_codon:yes stop_codon:yes gene_type:complete